ncbi:hypothetical protein AAVH_07802 [Aphelenchoides avenae]|nr:hypothetical protein AAVH_07802 [Aphelenchus avenae]
MSDEDDQVLGEDYEVQKILYHDVVWVLKKEGTMDKRRELRPNQVVFRVRWVGYGPGDDTWEPAEHVQHTTVFEDYCQKHGIHGQDRLTCEGRVRKVNADGSKSVKKKSVTRDPPPKKVKTKRSHSRRI